MPDTLYFLSNGGDAADAIRSFDWSTTELGPIEGWPGALRTAVGMMLSSSFPKAIVWGPSLLTLHNDAFRPILGRKPPAIGRSFRDIWSEAWEQIGPIAERAFNGEATFIEDFPLIIERDGFPEQTFFTFCYSPIRDESGAVAGMMDTVIETTASVTARRQLAAVNRELAHRMKNMLAMVSALASQTLRTAPDVASGSALFQARLQALSQAQDLLVAGKRTEAEIREVVDMSVRPGIVDPGRLKVSGPPVWLDERQVLSLSLALHELVTNATKYGALSGDDGQVEIGWQVEASGTNPQFRFFWYERGGPAVTAPRQTGFGSKLVERLVAADFDGEARLHFAPSGVEYELRASARTVTTAASGLA